MGDPVSELYGRHRRSQQPESRQVTAVLEAVADILRQESISPSPTAVFAAVMSSLEREDITGAPERASAMLTVLGTALEHAPTAPVLSRLPASMKVLLSLGRAAQDTPHALRGVIHCIGLRRDAPRCPQRRRRGRAVASLRQGVRRRQPPLRGRPTQGASRPQPPSPSARAPRHPLRPRRSRVRRHRREGPPRPRQSRSRAPDMHGSAGAKAVSSARRRPPPRRSTPSGACSSSADRRAPPQRPPPRSLPSWTSPSPSSRSTRATRS